MIDIYALLASLRKTVWFRRRGHGWSKRAHKRLSKMDSLFEDKGEITANDAAEFLRLYLQVQANTLLRDFGENAILVDADNAPLTYQIFRSDELKSLLQGGEGGGE